MRLTTTDHLRTLLAKLLDSYGTWERYPVGVLKAALRGHMEVEVTVDQWPDVTSFVLQIKQDQDLPLYMKRKVFVYTQNPSQLQTLVRKPGVVDWTKCWDFEACSENIYKILSAVAKENDGNFEVENDPSFMFDMHPGSHSSRTLPGGYTITSLTPDQAKMVNDLWEYNEGELTEKYIEYCIRMFPSTCIYNPQGAPVAWNLTWHCMCSGMAYVVPEERGKNLAGHMGRLIAFKTKQLGDTCYIFIDEPNKASLRFASKGGTTRLPGEVFWGHYRPPQSLPSKL